jgi:hypothetical protein
MQKKRKIILSICRFVRNGVSHRLVQTFLFDQMIVRDADFEIHPVKSLLHSHINRFTEITYDGQYFKFSYLTLIS